MTIYTISDHTADEWTALAQESAQRSADSFARSDTDGFMSQWASDQTSAMYRQLADWARTGSDEQEIAWPMIARRGVRCMKHDGLHVEERDCLDPHDDPNESVWVPVTEYRWVTGRYGSSVRVWDANTRRSSYWNPSRARKAATAQRNDERKGFRWGRVLAQVEAETYSAGMFVRLALRPVTDDADSIVRVVSTAHYEDSAH
ncbi:hypothetical protein SEA_MARGARET_33 [Gordonia phage Margaret]|nr:hypothetical protein SEA_MARGARET_33 [Gordonia phage Margaret]